MSLEVDSLRALAHPLRLQMLSLLTGAELSAAEVARELAITQANASYHLRQLLKTGYVEVIREEGVRGGVAKIYRHPWDKSVIENASLDSQHLYVSALASELVRRHTLAAKGGHTGTDAELWVEPSVWEDVVRRVTDASCLLHAKARPPRTPDTIRVNMTAAMFQMRGEDPGQSQ